MSILLTGGLGYIGSHTCVSLIEQGYDVVVLDNLANSKIEVLSAINEITGVTPKFYAYDLLSYELTKKVFEENNIDCIIHFAGLKAVGESVQKPLMYYENNLIGTINLLKLMQEFDVKNLVFSSSATVYGQAEKMPIDETFPTSATNPYGRTKLFIEEILKDFHKANPKMNITILRYFNPIGAHPSTLLGENPNGIPNNLMPYIVKVALGKLEQVTIFGNDYNTPDGTGVRDYLHVMDLAEGHICAIKKMQNEEGNLSIYNLGTGKGQSVLEVLTAFNNVCPKKAKYVFDGRRQGDIDTCYTATKKAETELGWRATRTLEDMCLSSFLFGEKNIKD